MDNILHWSLQQALIAGKILNTPCDGLKHPKEQYKDNKILSMDTIHQLLDKAKTDQYYHPYYPLWLTSIHSGLRRGEDMGTKWGEVNLLDLTMNLLDASVEVSLAPLSYRVRRKRLGIKP